MKRNGYNELIKVLSEKRTQLRASKLGGKMVVQVKFRRNMRQFVFEVIALERTRYVLALDEVLDATLDFRNTPQKCWSRYLSEIIRSADRHGSISLDVIVEKKGPRDEWLQVVSDRDLTY